MPMSPLDMAKTVLGYTEGTDRAALIDYLKTGGQNLDPATRAWCADFVNASLEKAGYSGTGSGMARSFLEWGNAVDPSNLQEGDIAVFGRGGVNSGLGHVGFVESYDPQAGTVRVLSGNAGPQGAVNEQTYNVKDALGFRRAAEAQAAGAKLTPEQDWMASMWNYAQAQSKITGIDPRIIVSQAALETGYGKHVANNNNYFGIKGGTGEPVETTEVINGKPTRVMDRFQSYENPEASFTGYGQFMMGDRYKALREAQGLEAQAAALGKSGYATDPDYGSKVLKIAQGIPEGGFAKPQQGPPLSAKPKGQTTAAAADTGTKDKAFESMGGLLSGFATAPAPQLGAGGSAAQLPSTAPASFGSVGALPMIAESQTDENRRNMLAQLMQQYWIR